MVAAARRAWWTLAAMAALVLLVAAVGIFVVGLGPVDLGRHIDTSIEVVDRDGRLLRPYATADGRWRLKATVADVDPRFFDVLFA